MIKDKLHAMRMCSVLPSANLVLTFEESEQEGKALAVLTQDRPAVFSRRSPVGISYGNYIAGKTPESVSEMHEMQSDWAVVRTNASIKEVRPDHWPPMDKPIMVMMSGIPIIAEGILAKHVIPVKDGDPRVEIIFLELQREKKDNRSLYINGQVQYDLSRDPEIATFVPHPMSKVIAWMYLGTEGEPIRPRKMQLPVHLFVDCEFEDSTKTLLSLGIVNEKGRIYYAFDSDAANRVQEEWVQKNVNNVLLDVPKQTVVWDLCAKHKTFQDFLTFVIAEEAKAGELDVVIHVDFPTDVAYVAPLLHLGQGNRIGTMRNFTFSIDYVDAYPTSLSHARQHNAAWDALAIWHHLGYYTAMTTRVMKDGSGAGKMRVSPADMLERNIQMHTEWYEKFIVPTLGTDPNQPDGNN